MMTTLTVNWVIVNFEQTACAFVMVSSGSFKVHTRYDDIPRSDLEIKVEPPRLR